MQKSAQIKREVRHISLRRVVKEFHNKLLYRPLGPIELDVLYKIYRNFPVANIIIWEDTVIQGIKLLLDLYDITNNYKDVYVVIENNKVLEFTKSYTGHRLNNILDAATRFQMGENDPNYADCISDIATGILDYTIPVHFIECSRKDMELIL